MSFDPIDHIVIRLSRLIDVSANHVTQDIQAQTRQTQAGLEEMLRDVRRMREEMDETVSIPIFT